MWHFRIELTKYNDDLVSTMDIDSLVLYHQSTHSAELTHAFPAVVRFIRKI